jgi:hypothetical protein
MVHKIQTLTLAACLLLSSCVEEDVGVRSARLTSDAGAGCQTIPGVGCCFGQTLYYCSGSKLLGKACQAGETCGWNVSFGMYVCGTSLLAKDPTGTHPRECSVDLGPPPDLKPSSDAHAPEGGAGCGPLGFAGCCTAQGVLHYCVGSQVMSLDCSNQPACGWNPQGGFYTCGTAGKPDPSGVHAMACATVAGDSGLKLDATQAPDQGHDAAPSVDLAADLPGEAGTDTFEPVDAGPVDASAEGIADGVAEGPVGLDASGLDVSGADGGGRLKASGGGGCSGCAAAGAGAPPVATSLLVAVFMALLARRRGS